MRRHVIKVQCLARKEDHLPIEEDAHPIKEDHHPIEVHRDVPKERRNVPKKHRNVLRECFINDDRVSLENDRIHQNLPDRPQV